MDTPTPGPNENRNRFVMALDDYRDKIIFAIFTLSVPGIAWLIVQGVNGASKSDVEKMILQAKETSYYMRDKESIQQRIQLIENNQTKFAIEIERMRDNAIINNEKVWRELALIRIELERIRPHSMDKKKEE